MRETKRFEIRCPVTVQVSNGPNHKVKVHGVLYDIGVGGARVALEQPVPPGTKITLLAHFRAPGNKLRRFALKESSSVSMRSHGSKLP